MNHIKYTHTHNIISTFLPSINDLCNCIIKLAATVPELLCGDSAVQQPAQILNFLRKQVGVDNNLNVHHLATS